MKLLAPKFTSRRVKLLSVAMALVLANLSVSITTFRAPQFTASATPSAFPIVKGESRDISIRIEPLYGFESEVALEIIRAPIGVVTSLEKELVFVGRSNEVIVNLRLDLPEEAKLAGTHYVIINVEAKSVLQPIELELGIVGVGTQYVSLENHQFDPGVVYIKRGATVKWTNLDYVEHTVTSENSTFGSDRFGFGKSWEWKFNQIGIYPYFCRPHPSMVGVVWVLE